MREVNMSRERRRHERHVVRINEKEALFRLQHNGRWHRIHDVNDVSISGIGLRFAEAIDAGTPIKNSNKTHKKKKEQKTKKNKKHTNTQDNKNAGTTEIYRVGVEFDPQRL